MLLDNQLAELSAKIANERPSAIQIRLWLQALLDSRPMPPAQLIHISDPAYMEAHLFGEIAELKQTIRHIAERCPDCPCCRQIVDECRIPAIA